MANSIVRLLVDDSGFNSKLKNAANTFFRFTNQIGGAKSEFAALADNIAKSTAAQQALNAAVKGNPYGAMLNVAQMAISKIIEKTTELSDAQKRAFEDYERKQEEQKRMNEAIGTSVGNLMAKYEMLRLAWVNLSNDQQRADWIKQNQSAFKNLGLTITDVTSAEDAFVNNTSKVVAALKARAEAEAYGDLYKQAIIKKAKNDANPTLENGRVVQAVNPNKYDSNQAKLAGLKNEDIKWKSVKSVTENGDWLEQMIPVGYTKSGVQKVQQLLQMGAQSRISVDDMEIARYGNLMSQAVANQNAAYAALGGLGSGGYGMGGGKGGSVEVHVKPVYVPEEGTPDYIKAMISDLQTQLGKEKDAGVREGLLFDIKALQDEYKSMTTLPSVGDELADDFEPALSPLQQLNAELERLKEDLELSPNTQAYLEGLQKIADKEKEIAAFKGLDNLGNDAKDTSKSFKVAASSISQVGSALNSIEDPTAKILGIIAQAIAGVAAGAGQAVSAKDTTSSGWAWIGAAAAITASMISMIAQIHSATGYAQGGIVGGNSFSGDNVGPVMLDAGEVILNRAQQNNVAAALQSPEGGGNYRPSYISGEQIYVALNRYTKRTGKGELMTWR